ncbi:hypothetical protein J6590_078071 [Homalodisca vitripennis]|nr:hypothetical protein J6590_078071 [Homalodisca vitripennis]
MEPITGDRPPLTINQQFLDKYTNYLPAVFQGPTTGTVSTSPGTCMEPITGDRPH